MKRAQAGLAAEEKAAADVTRKRPANCGCVPRIHELIKIHNMSPNLPITENSENFVKVNQVYLEKA